MARLFKYIEIKSPIRIDKFSFKKNQLLKRRARSSRKWEYMPSVSALLEYDVKKYSQAKILLGYSSRYTDNFNCILEHTLTKLFKNCNNPDDIAVMIVVDKDDNLGYFYNIKRRFHDKNIRFMVTEERFGIQGLHKYDKIIFQRLPRDCKVFFDFADDAVIKMKDFDKDILEVDEKFQDNIYIIHTKGDSYGFLPDLGKNMMLVPWLQKACSPTSVFPIISRRFIDIAQSVINDMGEEGEDWSPLSNTWIFDCYVDYISHALKRDGLGDRVVFRDMVKRFGRFDKYNGYNKCLDSRGMDRSDRAFITMYSQKTVDVMEKICKKAKDIVLKNRYNE